MGFYSTFIPEAIKEVKVFKGNIPASYGGRLSSLIDIRTRDGNMKQWEYGLSAGLISSKITANGPLKKDKSSVFLSRRRSHFRELLGNKIDRNTDFYFSDFNTKLNYIINEKNRLFFSLYYGKDELKINNNYDGAGIQWENFASTMRWNHVFSSKLFSNTTLHTSNYDYKLHSSYASNSYWNSVITNVNFKTDFSYFHQPNSTTRFGFNLGAHDFNPGNFQSDDVIVQNNIPEVSSSNANEFAFYLSNNYVVKEKFSITYGFRFSNFTNRGKATVYHFNDFYQVIDTTFYNEGEKIRTYRHIEPRVSLKYNLATHHVFTLNYSYTTQYIHLISNSVSPLTSLDVWLPSGKNIKPQKSRQLSFGYQAEIMKNKGLLTIESFYKKMQNQIDYIDHAYTLLNPLIESQLRFGEAWSYGIETTIKKNAGKFTGWISYTYSRTYSKINDINNNKKFPAYYDRPHDFNIFLAYSFSKRFQMSVNWMYLSGATFTSPTSFYDYNGYTVPIYSARNNNRLPDYHRLDFALSFRLNKREQRFNHGIDFSILNLYNHKNANSIHFNKHYDVFGNIIIPGNQYANDLIVTKTYLYTFMPSISYFLKF